MKKRMNKRGQDLSIGTLILIVLGIVVLVLLILGFSIGWGNLWEKINIFKGGSSIADVITACKLAIASGNSYDFCQDFKEIKVDGKKQYANCQDARIESGLEGSKLNCQKDGTMAANEYCAILNEQKKVKDTVMINQQECKETPAPAAG